MWGCSKCMYLFEFMEEFYLGVFCLCGGVPCVWACDCVGGKRKRGGEEEFCGCKRALSMNCK